MSITSKQKKAAALFLAIFAVYRTLIFGSSYDPRHILHAWRLELLAPRIWIAAGPSHVLLKPYGAVTVAANADKTSVSVDNADEIGGGVYIRTKRLIKDNRALLKFDVEYIEGNSASVRNSSARGIHFAELKPQNQYVVSDADDIDLFVYSSIHVKMRIKNIQIVRCAIPLQPQCKNDDDLIAKIRSSPDFPKGEHGMALAKYLLNWAANNSDYDVAGDLSKIAEEKFGSSSAGEIYYQYYEPSRAGGYCSSVALFFAKLLQLFDFDAFTIDFGMIKGTHVSVLLYDAASAKFYLLDPTFNGYFVNSTGRLLDLAELLQAPRGTAVFKQMPLTTRDFVLTEKEYASSADRSRLRDCHLQGSGGADKNWICKRDDFSLNGFLAELAAQQGLAATGMQYDYLFFEMLKEHVSGIGNGLRETTRAEFIEFLRIHKIETAAK